MFSSKKDFRQLEDSAAGAPKAILWGSFGSHECQEEGFAEKQHELTKNEEKAKTSDEDLKKQEDGMTARFLKGMQQQEKKP
jgi:hypothetical protein